VLTFGERATHRLPTQAQVLSGKCVAPDFGRSRPIDLARNRSRVLDTYIDLVPFVHQRELAICC
jgi:hypothetical protein